MTFIIEESICWNMSEWSSSKRRKVEWRVGERGMEPLPFLLRFLKKKVTMWSSVPQQPVQTMWSVYTYKQYSD